MDMFKDLPCEREDCRLTESAGYTTCMYFQPVYDRHGNNLNPDRNVTKSELWCSVCNKRWAVSRCAGDISYTEMEPPPSFKDTLIKCSASMLANVQLMMKNGVSKS